MKKIINFCKCEWEIFCFVESCESITNTKDYTIKKINSIYKKYGLQKRAYAFLFFYITYNGYLEH